jgi:2-dehydropantoate 2-reductase
MEEAVVIWGAGAIGGTIGASLAAAGHKVLFVDVVEEHVAAINAEGLYIEGPVAAFCARAEAVIPAEMTGRHRLILLAVKAHHTEAATRALLPFLAEDGAVVSCQNGLNELAIAEIVGPGRTIGAFVNFGADYLAPGRIMFGNRGAGVVGELDGSRSARIVALHELLRVFEPNAVLSSSVFGYLWGKCAYGAILKASALTNDAIADFIADPARRDLILRLVAEVLAIAKAEKVTPIGFDGFDPLAFDGDPVALEACFAGMIALNRRSGKSHSGIWRDLAVRKRQTDVGAQLAPVRQCATRHGLATPLLDRLTDLIGDIEQGRRVQGPELADLLGSVPHREDAMRAS